MLNFFRSRSDKLKALARDKGATQGERDAAQAALERLFKLEGQARNIEDLLGDTIHTLLTGNWFGQSYIRVMSSQVWESDRLQATFLSRVKQILIFAKANCNEKKFRNAVLHHDSEGGSDYELNEDFRKLLRPLWIEVFGNRMD